MSTDTVRNVIIIGSGPAGLTAAIYAARANLAPLVIEGEPSSTSDQPGGQLMLTTEVENFPGFPDGIMGPELMMNFRAQAQRFGAEFITEKVTRVDFSTRGRSGCGSATPSTRRDSIIVSTGARSLMLGLESERRLLGHGLSTCATCDGFFFRGQHIAVVGGGDSAVEEATFLTKFADEGHADPPPRRAARQQDHAGPRARQPEDRVPLEPHGRPRSSATRRSRASRSPTPSTARCRRCRSRACSWRSATSPNTDLFKGVLDMEDTGYLVTQPGSTYTNVDGVFACGDVQDHTYRQAITAAGSGCMAAIDAERWLEANVH